MNLLSDAAQSQTWKQIKPLIVRFSFFRFHTRCSIDELIPSPDQGQDSLLLPRFLPRLRQGHRS